MPEPLGCAVLPFGVLLGTRSWARLKINEHVVFLWKVEMLDVEC